MGDMREDKKLIELMRAIKMTVEDEERLRYKKLNAQIKRLEDIAAQALGWQKKMRQLSDYKAAFPTPLYTGEAVLETVYGVLDEIRDADLEGK